MDNRVNAFKVIEKHCGRNKKEDIIFYMTYGVYKKTFLEDLRSRGKGRAPVTLPEADFQRLKGAHLVDKHIERYVKQAEEMLGDTLKNVQKAILDSHQQELKKIVQKDNWWTESWLAIGNMILEFFKRLISMIVKR